MLEEERRKLWGGVVVGLNPRIRVYRYRKGHFFDQHCMSTLQSRLYNALPLLSIFILWYHTHATRIVFTLQMWSYLVTFLPPSTWWADFTRAFIPAYITGTVTGFFVSWILGQILLTCTVLMLNPSEGLLDVMAFYCYLFTPGNRPMGPCLAPIVVFLLHVLPNGVAEVNTVSLGFGYASPQDKLHNIKV